MQDRTFGPYLAAHNRIKRRTSSAGPRGRERHAAHASEVASSAALAAPQAAAPKPAAIQYQRPLLHHRHLLPVDDHLPADGGRTDRQTLSAGRETG
jgi:hypothetical protein